jgi:hypothetical protein
MRPIPLFAFCAAIKTGDLPAAPSPAGQIVLPPMNISSTSTVPPQRSRPERTMITPKICTKRYRRQMQMPILKYFSA